MQYQNNFFFKKVSLNELIASAITTQSKSKWNSVAMVVCVAIQSSSALAVFYPMSSLWCHYGRTPCGVNAGKRHWSRHHWDGLNMILACFFEPICLPLGVCASRLRLSPAGVTLTTEREAAALPGILCIRLWTCLRKTSQRSRHTEFCTQCLELKW